MFEIVIFTIVFFVASGISNVTGFGTGTISIPILLRFLPFNQTLLLVGIMQWFSGLLKMGGFFHHIRWRIALAFGLPALIATIAGSLLIFIIPHQILYNLFGLFIFCYGVALIFAFIFYVKKTWYSTLIGGIFYGLSAGIFGMRGPIRSIFLTAFSLSKKEYIATSGAIGLLADISRFFVYLAGGVILSPILVKWLWLFILVTIIAAYGAQLFVKKLPQRKFEIIVGIFLVIIGLRFLLFS